MNLLLGSHLVSAAVVSLGWVGRLHKLVGVFLAPHRGTEVAFKLGEISTGAQLWLGVKKKKDKSGPGLKIIT
jgi:hypothetical protein